MIHMSGQNSVQTKKSKQTDGKLKGCMCPIRMYLEINEPFFSQTTRFLCTDYLELVYMYTQDIYWREYVPRYQDRR